MKLTLRTAVALKLPRGKTDHIEFDDEIPGFGLRLREGGSRTWIYQYQLGSKQRRIVIGKAGALKPEKARELAGDLHATVRLGGDPAATKAAGKANAALSLKAIADRYLARQKLRLRPRSYVEVERHILKHAKQLHGMPIAAIDQRTWAARLGEVADSKGLVTANRTRASLSALYGWAMKEGLVAANPIALTNKHAEEERERTLSDSELVAVWQACREDDYGRIIRILLLTGQRLSEISGLRWPEVSLEKRLIELPGSRTKNKRAHQIPISDAVAAILMAQPRTEGRDLVFGYGENRPFSGWTAAKEKLDERIAEATGKPLPHWTVHDLRRTAATRMADLGVLPHVVEAVLNHVSGHKAGIAGIYNRAVYAPEKAQALAQWAAHVTALVEGRTSNVMPLKRA
jgi:integrase